MEALPLTSSVAVIEVPLIVLLRLPLLSTPNLK